MVIVGENENNSYTYSAFRLRAFNLIWNEYFRDEERNPVSADSIPAAFNGLRVGAKKDYYNTIRQELQEGDAIQIPIDATAETVSATDILEGIANQKLAMKRATYGTRYVDILRGYGINVNYQMLQRPEVVSVGRSTASVTDVVSTGNNDNQVDGHLGDLGGHAISGSRLTLKRKSFPEHGTLMGIIVVRPPNFWHKMTEWHDQPRTYQDFWDPGLVNMPAQLVTAKDVSISAQSSEAGTKFGYINWGEWYRGALNHYNPSLNTEDTLKRWITSNRPEGDDVLGWNNFTQCNPKAYNPVFYNDDPGDEEYADPPNNQIQVTSTCSLKALRMIPRKNISVFPGTV